MDEDFQFARGDRLDDFEIAEALYAGALAQVYRATDTLTRQTVVLKVPSLDIVNNPLVYYHFQNEVQILTGIRHPSIVRLVHRDRSTAYSIFEYIPGHDLRKRMVASKMMTLLKAKHYILQIARAVDYLHSCGIIHLDIKPENIIITPMDTVKIVDFGLARRLGDRDVLHEDFTKPHGTPYYAAPEQLERYRDDPRTDLYSLALVFFEMLTGRLPFEKSKDLKRARRRIKVDPIPPRHFRNDIPVAIDQFILQALNSEPAQRHASARDFIRALETSDETSTASESTYPNHGSVVASGTCALRSPGVQSTTYPRGIVAAIDDNDQAEMVVETALQEAVIKGATVTFLTVVSGDREDDWIRYADEVSGKKWGRRLEQFAKRFRHYGIDPVVRIRNGKPADEIIETARIAKADAIILGPSGKTLFKRLFGGRTITRVLKRAPCRVMVAQEKTPPVFPYDADPSSLTATDHQKIDYFLVALWIQQLNWLAAVVQGLLSEPLISEELHLTDNPANSWLEQISTHPQWQFLTQKVKAPLSSLDEVVAAMVSAVRSDDAFRLRSLYLNEALPLLCRLREGMQAVSTDLREQSTIVQFQRVNMLEQSLCPIDDSGQTRGGPIRQIQAIREYFCSYPDASPEQCLSWINGDRLPNTSSGVDQ